MEYLGFIGAIIALIVIVRILKWPLKITLKLFINVVIGITLLFVFNTFGPNMLGITVPINLITALVVGLLGIPGFIGIVIFSLII